MADGFSEMLDQALAFMAELRENNNRDWFEPRKDHYVAQIRKPAELMAEIMAQEISRMAGLSHSAKLLRIYRDIRFSKDKTPYNAYLRIIWAPTGRGENSTLPAFFFGAEPGRMVVGMGSMGFDAAGLKRFRAMVDSWGDELTDLIAKSDAQIAEIGAKALKRVPPPYAQDHPHGDLLRCKQLALVRPLAPDWFETGAVAAIGKGVKAFLPLHRFWMERLA
jgi:uncharacterized protein (TIGR02453 family)